jgi:hypothetical protein
MTIKGECLGHPSLVKRRLSHSSTPPELFSSTENSPANSLQTRRLRSNGALAQGTPEQQEACKPDVFRLCGNFIPDVDRIVACLQYNEPNLSPACHEVFYGVITEEPKPKQKKKKKQKAIPR